MDQQKQPKLFKAGSSIADKDSNEVTVVISQTLRDQHPDLSDDELAQFVWDKKRPRDEHGA